MTYKVLAIGYDRKDYEVICLRLLKKIELATKKFDLLVLLISNPNRVFTYKMIADIVWAENYDVYFRKTITNHISSFRQKLRITQDIPNLIKSVHNVGYNFS